MLHDRDGLFCSCHQLDATNAEGLVPPPLDLRKLPLLLKLFSVLGQHLGLRRFSSNADFTKKDVELLGISDAHTSGCNYGDEAEGGDFEPHHPAAGDSSWHRGGRTDCESYQRLCVSVHLRSRSDVESIKVVCNIENPTATRNLSCQAADHLTRSLPRPTSLHLTNLRSFQAHE